MPKIYRIMSADGFFDSAGEPMSFLTYEKPEKGDVLVSEGGDDANLDELAELCDQEAENSNHHSMVGAHEALAKILKSRVPIKRATFVMLDIARAGGLHEMV